jgi:plastocyanin
MSGSHRLWPRVLGAALAIVCLLVPVELAFAQDAAATVTMQNTLTFAPPTVHIAPGQSVQWTNPSVLAHTVTADDSTFDSGNVDPGGTFSWSFDTPGTYQYYCQPHGSAGLNGMSGTIVVDDPNAEEATPEH